MRTKQELDRQLDSANAHVTLMARGLLWAENDVKKAQEHRDECERKLRFALDEADRISQIP